jgi:hypothetical protein
MYIDMTSNRVCMCRAINMAGHRIFVGNLSTDATDTEFRVLFQDHGRITDIRFHRRERRHVGVGVVLAS